LKVLFVLGSANPFPGAGWTRIGFLAEKWSKKGHMVEVLGSFTYKSFSRRGAKKLGSVSIFNLCFSMELLHPLAFVLNALVASAVSIPLLILRRPDAVIVSVPSGDIGLGALMACRMTGAKYIVDYRDEWEDYAMGLVRFKVEKAFYSMIKKLSTSMYNKGQFVSAVTHNFIGSLQRRGIARTELIPNGADVRTFKPLLTGKKSNVFTVFYSGGVGGYYRLDVMAKALKRLRESGARNIKLIIVGKGEISGILNLTRELGIYGLIEYEGVMNDKRNLAKLIAEADVGLVPYDDNPLWKNSLPAKFFEYCACGIPVVATAHEDSLLAELVEKHQIGLVSPPMDEEKLAEAIYWLYENDQFREDAGRRARALIERDFDRNKIAERFLDLIRECV